MPIVRLQENEWWRWLAESAGTAGLKATGPGDGCSLLVGGLVVWSGDGVWRVLEELVRAQAKWVEGFVVLCCSNNLNLGTGEYEFKVGYIIRGD